MKHRVKTIKFSRGQDSNQMMVKKLLYNFLKSSQLVITEKRGRALKIYLDRVLPKTKEKTESNKNYLLRYFSQPKVVDVLFAQVGPSIKNINGGYTSLTKLNQRDSDGAYMVKIQWAHPITINWEEKKQEAKVEKKAKAPVKKEKVTDEPSA
ncbi:hypothetical protein BH09PAT1_BH09PAT1_0880 [soil metagenome]